MNITIFLVYGCNFFREIKIMIWILVELRKNTFIDSIEHMYIYIYISFDMITLQRTIEYMVKNCV